MKTRVEQLKQIPRPEQIGIDPEPPGHRFEHLCAHPRAAASRRSAARRKKTRI